VLTLDGAMSTSRAVLRELPLPAIDRPIHHPAGKVRIEKLMLD